MAQWHGILETTTMPASLIRDERPGDEHAIDEITRAAFRDHPHSSHTEHLIVDALRRAGALTVSLVAERAGEVAGHIAFSPVGIADNSPGWYGLGPVSVSPAVQGEGVGQALVRAGLERLRSLGARGCVLLGEPTYYKRFGFAHDPRLVLAGVPQEYFLSLLLAGPAAAGEVSYHAAFGVESDNGSRRQ